MSFTGQHNSLVHWVIRFWPFMSRKEAADEVTAAMMKAQGVSVKARRRVAKCLISERLNKSLPDHSDLS